VTQTDLQPKGSSPSRGFWSEELRHFSQRGFLTRSFYQDSSTCAAPPSIILSLHIFGIYVPTRPLPLHSSPTDLWPIGAPLPAAAISIFQSSESPSLHPSPLNPQPSTLNPQPSTLNPQPSILPLSLARIICNAECVVVIRVLQSPHGPPVDGCRTLRPSSALLQPLPPHPHLC
jgi:hypothetical protein